MNTRGLLDQLLKSGQSLLQDKAHGKSGKSSSGDSLMNGLGSLLGGKGNGASQSGLGSLISGAGGGALAAGAMGLLKGKRSRGMGGKVLTYGGLAALGVLAYKAYNNWQASQGVTALVAAAKADGHVDERERELIEGEFSKLSSDQELQHWLQAELNKPLDPAEVARTATTPEMAAEMYIASVMLVDQEHFMERAYLDELARQLKLDPWKGRSGTPSKRSLRVA